MRRNQFEWMQRLVNDLCRYHRMRLKPNEPRNEEQSYVRKAHDYGDVAI